MWIMPADILSLCLADRSGSGRQELNSPSFICGTAECWAMVPDAMTTREKGGWGVGVWKEKDDKKSRHRRKERERKVERWKRGWLKLENAVRKVAKRWRMIEKDNETEERGMGAGIGRSWLLVTECHRSIASVQVGCSHCRMTSHECRLPATKKWRRREAASAFAS